MMTWDSKHSQNLHEEANNEDFHPCHDPVYASRPIGVRLGFATLKTIKTACSTSRRDVDVYMYDLDIGPAGSMITDTLSHSAP